MDGLALWAEAIGLDIRGFLLIRSRYAAIKDAIKLLVEIRDFKSFHRQRVARVPIAFSEVDTGVVSPLTGFQIRRHHASKLDEGVIANLYG
ncbi:MULTISPECIES: hypothetical protein [unclassified Polaromonas]|jgi:hypothetical protein|uniref:hypothetical protein n=1 Tax=unclassified Polaromonas TaxID=2638319 RepID=UPI0025D18DCC|nr:MULTISPECIES: hypothetical protein [unclassified Polaromonas]